MKKTKYERLTDKKYRYKKCRNCGYQNCQYCDDIVEIEREAYNRLAELEDKIENGTLVELPCKVGGNIYEVMKGLPVEEMSNIITEVAFVQAHELNGDENLSDIVATALYKAGYRHKKELTRIKKNYKIGLGKSQSWVKKLKNDKEQLESENFNLLRTIDTIREEMAEEIYKEARERVNEGIEWLNCSKDKPGKEYMKGVTFGLNLFNKALVNTIKKYGVEVLNEKEAKN